jgi:streptogramin lyase
MKSIGLRAVALVVVVMSMGLLELPTALAGGPDQPASTRPSERWTRQFGSWMDDSAGNVAADGRGDSYVVGTYYLGGKVLRDAFIRSYDASGSLRWGRRYHPEIESLGRAVAVDSRGNAYMVGSTEDDDWVNSGAFIRAFSQRGELRWTRRFGSDRDDSPSDVAVDDDGNVYVVGWTRGALGRQAPSGGYDAFIRSYRLDGRLRWTRQFGTTSGDQAESVAVDDDGTVYVVGQTGGALPGQSDAGKRDAFVRSYGPAGTLNWTMQFGTAGADEALGVAVGSDGAFCVAGNTNGILPGEGSQGEGGAFVRCYDASGRLRWTRQGAGNASSVAIDDAHGVIVAGEIWGVSQATSRSAVCAASGRLSPQQTIGESEVFVRAYDPGGALQWARRFGGPGVDFATAVASGPHGAILLAGAVQSALPGHKSYGGLDAFIRMYR